MKFQNLIFLYFYDKYWLIKLRNKAWKIPADLTRAQPYAYVVNVIHSAVVNGTGGEIRRGMGVQNRHGGLWV